MILLLLFPCSFPPDKPSVQQSFNFVMFTFKPGMRPDIIEYLKSIPYFLTSKKKKSYKEKKKTKKKRWKTAQDFSLSQSDRIMSVPTGLWLSLRRDQLPMNTSRLCFSFHPGLEPKAPPGLFQENWVILKGMRRKPNREAWEGWVYTCGFGFVLLLFNFWLAQLHGFQDLSSLTRHWTQPTEVKV